MKIHEAVLINTTVKVKSGLFASTQLNTLYRNNDSMYHAWLIAHKNILDYFGNTLFIHIGYVITIETAQYFLRNTNIFFFLSMIFFGFPIKRYFYSQICISLRGSIVLLFSSFRFTKLLPHVRDLSTKYPTCVYKSTLVSNDDLLHNIFIWHHKLVASIYPLFERC